MEGDDLRLRLSADDCWRKVAEPLVCVEEEVVRRARVDSVEYRLRSSGVTIEVGEVKWRS